MMEVLTGATGINIERSHISNIGRNQYNYYATHQTIIQTGGKKGKINRDLPELSEFMEVKRSDIYKDKDVCYSWRLCSNRKDDTEAAVYTAQIMIAGHFGDSKFTVKTYHGQNGKKEWQRDFLGCSRDWHGDVPLFGYNKSSIPSLIFHGELVPISLVEVQVGWVGRLYFEMLRKTLRCSRNELWMDPTKGRFCRGPVGPKCIEWIDELDGIPTPSDVGFLEEDVVIRYFSSIKHDDGLMWVLSYSNQIERPKEVPSTYYPQIISGFTNSTIAFNRNVRWGCFKGCLRFAGRMADGATRFLLADHGHCIHIDSIGETSSWLSRASSVFHFHNVQFDEDLSNFKLLFPVFEIKGTLQRSKCKRQRRQLGGPIYIFFLPTPSPDAQFYFWSHDPSGQGSLLPDMCKYLGLPINLSVCLNYHQFSWPTKVYKALHNYQLARGFDPTTTDFAHSIGYSTTFEIVAMENHFHNVDIAEVVAKNVSNSNRNPKDDRKVESTQPMQGTTAGSLLNTLSGWFTLDVVESSGISAAAI